MRTAVALVLLVLVAACGSTAPGATEPVAATSAPASANLVACQHYKAQGAYMKNLATPTLLDIATFTGWVNLDATESTGKLSHAFAALYQDLDAAITSIGGNVNTSFMTAADNQVKHDCEALGVTVSPAA